jgi:ABC-type proline/glycine betaine transport system substrate-binding protein
MLDIENGAKPDAAVRKWIAENPARVQEWLA